MATHSAETKLMDNYLSSTLPDVDSFAACFDEERFPMLFYVDKVDSQLYLVHREVKTGQNIKPISISQALGVKSGAQYVSLVQSGEGHVALAAGFFGENSTTDIHLFEPATPLQLKNDIASLRLAAPAVSSSLHVSSIVMTDLHSEKVYPHVALVLDGDDQQTIQPITVNLSSKSWDWDDSWELPESPTSIMDSAWTVINSRPAMWVLASTVVGSETAHTLHAYAYVHGGMATRKVTVPPGLSNNARISVVTNASRQQDLLLLGNGLHLYKAASLHHDGATPSLVSNHGLFASVTQASVHQHADKIRIWFSSQDTATPGQMMCYCRLTTADLDLPGPNAGLMPTPLTSKHLKGKYSCLVNPHDDDFHDQHFMFVDIEQKFQVASQSPAGSWRKTMHHFSFPTPERYITLRTYTTVITFHDKFGSTELHKVKITPSDTTSPVINGVRTLISPRKPLDVVVIPNGKLFIINETHDLAAATLTLSGDTLNMTIEPTPDVQKKLSTLNTVKALTETHVVNEHGVSVPLVPAGTDPKKLLKAASNLNSLKLRAAQLDPHQMQHHHIKPIRSEGFGDFLDDAWNWIEEKGESVIHWLHKEGKAMLTFAIAIGKEIRTIAVETWNDVVRIAKVILHDLEIAWDILKALVGALFNWRAIMEAQQAISKNLKNSVSYLQGITDATLKSMGSWIDTEIEGLEDKLDSFDVLLQGDTGNLLTNMKSGQADPSDLSSKFSCSAKGSMVQHALMHGNTAQTQGKFAVDPTQEMTGAIDSIVNTTTTWLANEDVVKRLSDFAAALQDVFKNGPSLKGFVKLAKDLISLFLDLIRKGIDDVFKLIRLCADAVISALEAEIEIPILGPLLKWIASTFFDVDLTYPSIIDIAAFLLAIVKVEVAAIASVDWDFDLVNLFPPLSSTVAAIDKFFTPSTTNSSTSRKELFKTPEALFEPSIHWMRYSLGCAGVHPVASLVKVLLGAVLNGAKVVNSMSEISSVHFVEPFSTGFPNLEKLEIFLHAVDIAFSVPAFDKNDRSNLGSEYAGYALSSLVMVVRGLNKLFFKIDTANFFFESFALGIAGIKTLLYSISLHSQLQIAKDDDTKHDVERAIGNMVCSLFAAIGTWLLAGLGPYQIKHDNEEAGFGMVIGGMTLNFVSDVADYGVDQARGISEIKAKRGQYNGMKH